MMYCKDCKYYKYDRVEHNNITRGYCLSSKFQFSFELESEDGLIYHDSEDYSAGLYVGELFGCVHFKKKEDIQNLLGKIETDFRALFSVVNRWKEISEDKWINKNKFNSHQSMFIRMECDQLVYDCEKLLEEIEINESKKAN